jgi:hypothetical protein
MIILTNNNTRINTNTNNSKIMLSNNKNFKIIKTNNLLMIRIINFNYFNHHK